MDYVIMFLCGVISIVVVAVIFFVGLYWGWSAAHERFKQDEKVESMYDEDEEEEV